MSLCCFFTEDDTWDPRFLMAGACHGKLELHAWSLMLSAIDALPLRTPLTVHTERDRSPYSSNLRCRALVEALEKTHHQICRGGITDDVYGLPMGHV